MFEVSQQLAVRKSDYSQNEFIIKFQRIQVALKLRDLLFWVGVIIIFIVIIIIMDCYQL